MKTAMRIDAHQHFWRIADREGHWPPPDLLAVHRSFGPADLLPALERCRIGGTVLVQSLPTAADTAYLLALASRHAFVLGVVGWVDMSHADAARQIAQLAGHQQLKGLRPMLQDLPNDEWADDPAFDASARAMVEHGLSFDALVRPRQLRALLAFARRHPRLPIVIDHAAKPRIAQGDIEVWSRDLAAFGDLPNVHCKLSGLLTEAGERVAIAVLAPYVDHLFSVFGTSRLMWGSDWPVLRLAADYEAWFAMALSLCKAQAGIDGAALEAILGGNARNFYRLH